MADNCSGKTDIRSIKEAVCIDTNRVYDSCADKDCLADLRVYLTDRGQSVLERATSVRCRAARILNCLVEVEKIPFNKGFYSVDLTFFVKVTVDAYTTPQASPVLIDGLATFSKKSILYGSDGNVKIFSSSLVNNGFDEQMPIGNSNPRAKVQCVDPICLDASICRECDCCNTLGNCSEELPANISNCFEGTFGNGPCEKALKVTLGVFTIVQLERDVQMLVPAYDFCVPTKECECRTETPCDAFKRISFPVDEFFPPNQSDMACSTNTSAVNALEHASCNCFNSAQTGK